MKKQRILLILFIGIIISSCSSDSSDSSDELTQTYKKFALENPPLIGEFEGIEIFEGGISGMIYIPGTEYEFYLINDRGPNLVMTEHAMADGQNVKVFPFPDYAPKIFRAKLDKKENRFYITETMPLRKPDGTYISGLPFPGNMDMNREIAWKDLNGTEAGTDKWGIDAEAIAIGNNNDLWISDEYRTSIWNIDKKTGKTIAIFGPELLNEHYLPIDTVFKYRRPNRGFESVAVTPNGLVYAMLQSPMWFPDPSVSDSSRLTRILQLNPNTGETQMFFYEMEDAIDDISIRDWKIGDMTAINDTEFLVIEHASAEESQFMKIFKFDISEATPITKENFNGKTPEQLNNAKIAKKHWLQVVEKTLVLDLVEAGYNPFYDKPEGITIINENTIAIINDNDYDIDAPFYNQIIIKPEMGTFLYLFETNISSE